MNEILKQLEKIDPERKEKIKRAYYNAAEKIGSEEFVYIKEKIGRKLYTTENSQFQWVRELSLHYKNLNQILENHLKNQDQISSHTVTLISAALFYFINPYDMIPDFNPHAGYVDDLFVLMTCLDSISGNDYTSVSKHFRDIIT